MPKQKKTAKFKQAKVTKGAIMFQEIDDDGKELKTDEDGAVLRTFYVRKAALGGAVPENMTVTLEW